MASSLEELLEEWLKMKKRYCELNNWSTASLIDRFISDLHDTMLVMQAEEVRRGAVPK